MPWEIKEENGEYCVYKKSGEKLKCYKVKGKAEAYLKALYASEPEMKASVTFSQIGGSAIQFDLEASEKDPRFLVFRNAILARAEVNANRDEIFPEGIKELAGTIAGCPINDEHTDQFVGSFTGGRATDDGALSVDGFLWAIRWPDLAESVKSGKKGLSVEANADKIVCSKCGTEYNKETGKSCAHIMSRKAKLVHGAVRQLHGLTAMGGATTYTPAGTGAQFSNEIYMVASKEVEDPLLDKIIDLIASDEDRNFAKTMLEIYAECTD